MPVLDLAPQRGGPVPVGHDHAIGGRAPCLGSASCAAPTEARRLLTSIRGVGDWTYAEIAQRALGDADAVSVGDFHLAADVVYQLTGAFDGTDDQMLTLLAPFDGHRYRAVRMLEIGGRHRPRRGPRMAIPPHRYG